MNIINNFKKIHIMKNTAVTIGNFDGVHIGHQDIINKTISIGKEKELKSLLFTFSNHPTNFFSNESIKNLMTNEDKCKFIRNMGIEVVINIPFDEFIINLTPEEYVKNILVERLKAKEIVIGHDFRFGKNRGGDGSALKEFGQKYGFNVSIIDPIKIGNIRVSSSFIRKLLSEGNIEKATKFLGRNYEIKGSVIHGKKLGRKLGFPTINLDLDKDILTPKTGVYYTKIKIKDTFYDGATNIGYNPTIENSSFSVETHIIDFDGDLYNQEAKIYFIERIRNEKKFSSIDKLKEQMDKDINKIKIKKNIYL